MYHVAYLAVHCIPFDVQLIAVFLLPFMKRRFQSTTTDSRSFEPNRSYVESPWRHVSGKSASYECFVGESLCFSSLSCTCSSTTRLSSC